MVQRAEELVSGFTTPRFRLADELGNTVFRQTPPRIP
jgi:hypothetical protein